MLQNSSPLLTVNPTFLLRGLDPSRIMDQYINGSFPRVQMPTEKINISLISPVVSPSISSNPEDEIYMFRTKGNSFQTVATTNHQRYYLFTKEGREILKGGVCDWCRVSFDHIALGIPVRLDVHRDEHGREIFVYYLDGCMCSCECALAELKRNFSLNYRYRNALYMDSEQLLRHLYSVMYPDAGPLREAPHYRLLKQNEGSLTLKEYHDKKHIYVPTPNLLLAPVKQQYLKIPVV